ncbi:hypothetical protein D9619_011893 [Psilocybe cf. subviscida]|uniref:ribonuclease H n=1 Tax=Psilocybe cf. subviscida TaxID=2480587 RepID=A0A8H5B0A9_9AGAR|nr:hypothetical protein D9619_011893 [Psilocybe cf. subviscida]
MIVPANHDLLLGRFQVGLTIAFDQQPSSGGNHGYATLVIQRLGNRWLLSSNPTSPPPLPPTKTTNRTRQNQNTTLLDIARQTDPNHERINPFLHPPWRRLASSFNGRLQTTPCEPKKRSNEEKRRLADEHITNINEIFRDKSNIVIYTDGSLVNKNGFRRVGAATVAFWNGQEIKHTCMGLGGHAEVYDGELAALMMGITMAVNESQRNPDIKHIHIYTDNSSALSTICNPTPTCGQHYKHTFYEKATSFLDSDNDHRLSISWCPSHCGVAGNERADELAKQATLLVWSAPISISRTNALRRAKLATLRDWIKDWRQSNKQGWFAIADRFQPSLKPTKHAKHLKTRHEVFGRLIQARTGHAYTGKFRRRFFPSEPFRCPCDNQTVETREHIIISCPRYETHWDILRKVSPTIALSEILGTQDGVEALATFLELSGAFTHDGKPRHNTAHQIPNPDNPEDNADDDDIDSLSVDSVPTSQPPSDYG